MVKARQQQQQERDKRINVAAAAGTGAPSCKLQVDKLKTPDADEQGGRIASVMQASEAKETADDNNNLRCSVIAISDKQQQNLSRLKQEGELQNNNNNNNNKCKSAHVTSSGGGLCNIGAEVCGSAEQMKCETRRGAASKTSPSSPPPTTNPSGGDCGERPAQKLNDAGRQKLVKNNDSPKTKQQQQQQQQTSGSEAAPMAQPELQAHLHAQQQHPQQPAPQSPKNQASSRGESDSGGEADELLQRARVSQVESGEATGASGGQRHTIINVSASSGGDAAASTTCRIVTTTSPVSSTALSKQGEVCGISSCCHVASKDKLNAQTNPHPAIVDLQPNIKPIAATLANGQCQSASVAATSRENETTLINTCGSASNSNNQQQQQLIQNLSSENNNRQDNNNNNQEREHEQKSNQQQQKSAFLQKGINTTTTANNSSSSNLENDPAPSLNQPAFYCRRRRLSYLQSLLLRKWPFLAIAICIMSSLIFSLLLSALTVYLVNNVGDCSALKLMRASALAAAAAGPLTANKYDSRMLMFEAAGQANSAGQHQQQLTSLQGSESELEGRISAAIASMAEQAASETAASRFRRLSNAVWPLHYDIFIWPRIAEPFNFTGKVSINVLCKEETSNITFHSRHLTLNAATLALTLAPNFPQASNSSQAPKILRLDYDKELQHSIVHLDDRLKVGHAYTLSIDFEGVLADDLAGFYRIRYEQANSTEPTWIAATQFQATDARKAFPCFDEPLFKATFSIKIKHWKNMTAISNMPIVSSQSDDQLWVTDTFAKSLSMSTYLVAFAVTNFESRSDGNITVWARPGQIHTAEYALKITPKILRHYEQFFGLEYPLPKMDMIALPDFNAGAMENWGLITYRETVMLLDEKKSSVINKERIANVVAHELAHQWFGNLVTPKWWDDLWLNEGFASFVEYLGVDHIAPHWKMMDKFSFEELQVALRLDALSNSHPISVSVRSPEEISEIFDSISYSKGASVIRMMMNFLTEPVMKRGLQTYLKALKYSNAEQSDLWGHLASALPPSDQIDVANVMNSWTLQTGYPLVTLKRRYDNSRQATLEQHRYQSHSSKHKPNTSNKFANSNNNNTETKWEVPITYTWKSDQNWDTKTRFWLHQNDSGPVELTSAQLPAGDNEWVLLNINQVGYYRVNYDERNWQLLVDQLKQDHTKISSANRAQIMTDLMEMARSGLLTYKLPMEATKYLLSEQDYIPWDASLSALDYIESMLERSSLYGDWLDYINTVLEPLKARYRHKSWLLDESASQMDDFIEANKHATAIAWACQSGDPTCIDKAKRLFAEWRFNGTNTINPILRFHTYCSAIEHGSKDDWDFLWRKYLKEESASERDRFMKALCCTREPWLLIRYLELSFGSSQNVRRQDGGSVIRMIGKNKYGREIAFNFLRENWTTLKDMYGKSSFAFGNIIRSLAKSMNTESELKQVMDFYELVKGDLGAGRRTFQITLEEIEGNVAWRKRNFKFFETWLKEFKSSRMTK